MPIGIRDVAARAGVSIATVSRVLANKPHVREETRRRVLAAARELNYRPSRVARSLRTQCAAIIGLIIPDIQNPFFTSFVRAVEDVAYDLKYAVFLCNSDENLEKESLYIDLLLAEHVAGVVIAATRESDSECRRLVEAGMPVVAADRRLPSLSVDTVVVDNVQGAYTGVRHLIDLGHRRIGYVGGPLESTTGRERYEGYCKALLDCSIEPVPNLIRLGGPKQEVGYQSTCDLLDVDHPPTAILASNNLTTLGALNAIHGKHLRIPDDVAIVGFDDMPWAPSLNPPLTAISQPVYELGRCAAQLLLKRVADRSRRISEIVLETHLVIRSSCGAKGHR